MKKLCKFKPSDQTEERSAEAQLARDIPVKECKMDKTGQVVIPDFTMPEKA